jgi:U3 small nucleolar RNA-associated protein 13
MNQGNLALLNEDSLLPFDSLLDDLEEGDDEVISFTCHPHKKELVVAMKSKMLVHWDYSCAPPKKVRSIKGHAMPVLALDYDRTGTLVASGSADRHVRVWDVPRGHCTHVFRDHTDIVTLVRFHPDPRKLWLFSAADDCSLCVFDLTTKALKFRFEDHVSPVTGLAFLGDGGSTLASAGRDKVLNFYSLSTGGHQKTVAVMDELSSLEVLNDEHSAAVLKRSGERGGGKKGKKGSFAPSSSDKDKEVALVTAGRKGILYTFRVKVGGEDGLECTLFRNVEPSPVPSGDGADTQDLQAISSMVYARQDGYLVMVTADSNFIYYNLDGAGDVLGKPTRQLMGCNDEILALAMVPLSASSSSSSSSAPSSAAGSSDTNTDNSDAWRGLQVAVAINSPQVRLVSMAEGYSFRPLDGHTDIVMSLAVSPDGYVI